MPSGPPREAADACQASQRRSRHGWHRRFGAKLRHSLRLKLIALFVLFAVLMSAAFIGGMQRALSLSWREATRPMITDYVDRLAAEIGSPPDVARAQALADRLPLTVRIEGPMINWRSAPQDERSAQQPRGWRRQGGSGPEHDRGFTALLTRTSADGHRIAFGLGEWSAQQRAHAIGWITLGVLLVLTGLAYVAIRRMLDPLSDIRAGAERFGRGDLAQPIPVRRSNELGDLARRINRSASQLHGMLEAKRALLLSISHELRSPLTRARLNAELLPTDAKNDERLRAALLRDIAEMRDLIDALLEGERLASPHAALQLGATDIAALARAVVDERVPSDAGSDAPPPVLLIIDDTLPIAMALDAARIRVLLRNLLVNALQNGRAAQPPELTLRAEARELQITVRDFGPGVDAALLPRLTEAFLRADSARQRATGGVGLGLYLCRLIALAHGGTIEARNAAPGLEWLVRLPIRVITDSPG